MEGDDTCITCLRNGRPLSKVILKSLGRNYDAMVCVLCLKTVRKIYTFQTQCARAVQLLEEYKTNGYTAKSWSAYSNEASTSNDSELQSIAISEAFCLDIRWCEEVVTAMEQEEGDGGDWSDGGEDELLLAEGGEKVDTPIHQPAQEDTDDIFKDDDYMRYSSEEWESEDDFMEMIGSVIDEDPFHQEEVTTKEEQMEDMERKKMEPQYLEASYKCDLCYVGFRVQRQLDTHMKKRHSQEAGDLECWLCHQRFGRPMNLRAHLRAYHTQRLWCGICNKRFNKSIDLRNHIDNHRGIFHHCQLCNRKCPSAKALRHHMNVNHNGSERLSCPHCTRTFSTQDGLHKHIKSHEQSFSCTQCPATFSNLDKLRSHEKNKHTTSKHYCVICDIHFSNYTNYKGHQKTKKHADPSLFTIKCSKCNRKFKSEKELSVHVAAIHDRVLQYCCTLCPAKYGIPGSLRYHRRRVHEGKRPEKRFPCTFCDKAFTTKEMLKNHIRTHTGEQPFVCGECGRSFSQKSSMQTHIKLIHLKKKNNENKKSENANNDNKRSKGVKTIGKQLENKECVDNEETENSEDGMMDTEDNLFNYIENL